jgi:hypothetical protein
MDLTLCMIVCLILEFGNISQSISSSKLSKAFDEWTFFDEVRARVARWFIFEPQIPVWVNFGVPWLGKMLIYFMAICIILWSFGTFCVLLVHFVFFWYIFSGFGIMHQEKSGNPGAWTFFVPSNHDCMLKITFCRT